ncbi:MAG: nucleotidyltransferase family protein [Cellulomonas sp.]
MGAISARMEIVLAHRDEIRDAAHRHRATTIAVFGSVARGDDGPASDVNFLVDLDVRRRGLSPLEALRVELEGLLGLSVDVAPRQLLSPQNRAAASAEAVPL